MTIQVSTAKRKIWVIEDDQETLDVYSDILSQDYNTNLFPDLTSFWNAFKMNEKEPDLILADLQLGQDHFLRFLKSEKKAQPLPCPLLIVSGDDKIETLKAGFEHGATDYLTKPFRKNELLIKLQNILERFCSAKEDKMVSGDSIVFDPSNLTIKRGSSLQVQLTAKELQIFSVLHRAKGQKIIRKQLEAEIWGETSVTNKSLDVHIFNLRKKLAKLSITISFTAPDGYAIHYGS